MATTANIYLSHVLTRENFDDFPYVTDGHSVRTWRQFTCAVNGWKQSFTRASANRVALYFTDLFDSAASLFGAWAAGIVAILPADTTYSTCKRLAGGIADFCAGEFPDGIGIPKIEITTCNTPCTSVIDDKAELLELFTSGSTGTPKCISKRLEQLFSEVDSICIRPEAGGRATQDTLVLSTVSQQHIYGLLYYLLWPIAAGLSVWPRRIAEPAKLFAIAKEQPHCALVSSPAMLAHLPDDASQQLKTLNHWKVIFTSGGPLSDEHLKRTLSLTGISPTEILGSSESGGIATRLRQLSPDGNVVSQDWHALPPVLWRSQDGLLSVKSPWLHSNGWELLNDRIEVVSGHKTFLLLGRADRIVKINEKRISLDAVENALTNTVLVLEAKALQLEDARRSLAVVATLTAAGINLLRSNGKFTLIQTLKNELDKSFERICLPRRWRFVTMLPENSMGKTTTSALSALFSPDSLQAVLIERTDQRVTYAISAPADLPYFEGHFPDFAILPGLTQIQWAVELARKSFSLPAHFSGLVNIKFMKPIRPGHTIEMALALMNDNSSVAFTISTNNAVIHAKGKLLFANEVPM